MKIKVTYKREVTYEGTIEAESEAAATKKWDDGYTPEDETEVSQGYDELKKWEVLE